MYEAFYHLSSKPFGLSPDPGFFFASGGHNRVLAYLRYGISKAEGFVVITGDIGTGKSTLIRMLLSEVAKDSNLMTAHLVTTQLEPDELIRFVCSSFGLIPEGKGKAELLRRLETHLKRKALDGKRALLIVDEVQNMPEHTLEELRMLSNFHFGERPLIQSCLLGQGEFQRILRSRRFEQLRQRVAVAHHLGPMNRLETRQYVEHRLRQAGWEGRPEFTPHCFDLIYNYTEGVPRRINTLCDRLMLLGFLEQAAKIDGELARKCIAELREEYSAGSVESSSFHDVKAARPVTGSDPRLAALERRVAKLERLLAAAGRVLHEEEIDGRRTLASGEKQAGTASSR